MDPVYVETRLPADVLRSPLGYLTNLRKRFTCQDLHTEPRLELVFFGPNEAHWFSGISVNHGRPVQVVWVQSDA
jgi:hypothetical protein